MTELLGKPDFFNNKGTKIVGIFTLNNCLMILSKSMVTDLLGSFPLCPSKVVSLHLQSAAIA